MTVDLGVLIGIVVGVGGLIVGCLGYFFNRNKQLREEVQASAKIETTLTHISKGVDDIRVDQKASEKHMAMVNERLTRVEESTKSAHRRIDQIKGEINR
ncbi:hypothetical protein [Alkalihalobacillus pseudalcaliphilus]|uniref:hypothetical protein n=1 Tax=Alkalihalobacillus pseudalcaliphilus TaxID=79884 RepID=UPI00064D8E49|nr:hypothetical protein [Alkalihalobacillus pseudalcaliphilus]KMK77631.1 hypothetical protein AB990_04005 [Alkalihalobacillus pseudalcaliphilus]